MNARRLTVYLARSVLAGIGLTGALLLAIFTLVELLREARALTGDYGALQMLWFLLQTTPRRLHDIFPFVALIGTLLGLGTLAGTNELVAMRAAGFGRRHLAARSLLLVALGLVLVMAMAEWWIPDLEARARAERQQARSGQLHLRGMGELWLRDGVYMLRLGEAIWMDQDQLVFNEVLIYQLDEAMRPQAILRAEHASHVDGTWQLSDMQWRQVLDGQSGAADRLDLPSALTPELFQSAISRPRLLALGDLYRIRTDLQRSGLDTRPYDQAFWARLFFPVNVLAMVLIALPFVFKNPRGGQRTSGLFIGVSLGLGFFVISRLSVGMGLIWPLPLWLSSLMPALLIIGLSAILLRRR